MASEKQFENGQRHSGCVYQRDKRGSSGSIEEETNNTLGYSKYDHKNKNTLNSRNGHTKKTVKSQFGKIELDIPRDADGEYELIIVKKHERTISSDLEGMIVSLFASGLSNREIGSQMNKIYGLDVSPEMVTRITDKILPIAKEWQSRLLNEMYPIIYLDGIVFNVNKDGKIVKKTAYVVFAVTIEGKKDILGIWIREAESSKFWMGVLADLRNRGVRDILICSVDGLKGSEDAIKATYPKWRFGNASFIR